MADRQLTTDMIDFFLGFAKNLMESGISEYARGELALLGYLYFEHDGATPEN